MNERDKNPKAKSRLSIDEFGVLTEDEKRFHEELVTYRNKALAHSEFDLNPTNFNPRTGVFSSVVFSLSNQDIDMEFMCTLLEKFISVCHDVRARYASENRE